MNFGLTITCLRGGGLKLIRLVYIYHAGTIVDYGFGVKK